MTANAGTRASTGARLGTVAGAILVVVVAIYMALPLARSEAAHNACVRSLAGDGTASTEWVPAPPAHWVCRTTPEGSSAAVSDMGWWP
jgi:hypothetical protein